MKRIKSGFGVGFLFVLIIIIIYVEYYIVYFLLLHVSIFIYFFSASLFGLVTKGSPIQIMRFWLCHEDDPAWLVNLEGIIQFLFYGFVLGYFINESPKLTFKYVLKVTALFFVTLFMLACFMFLLFKTGDISSCNSMVFSAA